MEAATKTAIERKTERRPKTRPRSSSWPDLTNIKVVAVTRLSGTWVILGYNHSVKDLDVDGGCCYMLLQNQEIVREAVKNVLADFVR